MPARNQHAAISAADKMHCVQRELRYRYRVYDRLVAEGKMTAAKPTREIALMEAVAVDMRAAVEAERVPTLI